VAPETATPEPAAQSPVAHSVFPRLLGLTEVIVRDLQLTVLIRRRKCTTVEKSILLLELLKLMRNGGVVLIV
jgi:hypothetical protein